MAIIASILPRLFIDTRSVPSRQAPRVEVCSPSHTREGGA